MQPAVSRVPVISLDIFPTAMALAGTPAPKDRVIDGVSLLPLLSNPQARQLLHDALFWRMGAEAAVRRGDWKLVRSDGKRWHLFDLASDPAETKDLAESKPPIMWELQAAYREWEAQLRAPAGASEGEESRRGATGPQA